MKDRILETLKNKKFLLCLLVMTTFILVALYYYETKIAINIYRDEYVSIYDRDVSERENGEKENIFTTVNLKSGDYIEQSITLSDGDYNGLAVKLKYNQFNSDTVIHAKILKNDGTLIGEGDITQSNIGTEYIKIPLSNTLIIDSKTQLYLQIDCISINDKDIISFQMNESLTDENNQLSINEVAYVNNLDTAYVHAIKDTTTIPIFIVLVVFTLAVVLAGLYCGLKSPFINYEKCFLILFPLVCSCYLVMFTPQTIPDEQLHFDSAYQYSNMMMFKERDTKRTCDLKIKDNVIIDKEHYYYTKNLNSLTCSDQSLVKVEDRLVRNAPIAYVPSAVGITLARIMGLGAVPLYTLGRIFNILACYFLLYFAIKKIPFGKSVLFSLTMIPMVPHLVASYSYDGMIISLSFLLTAYILNMAYGQDNVSKKDLVITSLISVCLAPCKLVYASICCLSFIIPKDKMSNFKFKYWPQVLMLILAIGSILIFQLSKIADIGVGGNIIEWAGKPGYTLSWALSHPASAINVFINTLIVYGGDYISVLIGSALGWLRIKLPWFVIDGFIIIMALSMLNKKDDKYQIKASVKFWALLLFLGSSVLIMYSMFTGHTPIGNPTIEGVQGRYFIPLIPLLYLFFKNNWLIVDARMDRWIVTLCGLFQAMAVITAFVSIITY
ncbi:MAG: DUF2142 domain-containing protein [Beduini sp.]|uniref:DUF2142 domain-containing protein n=1 Tax=Beduini sp. TaxID=1922300 RepID=UPI003990A917